MVSKVRMWNALACVLAAVTKARDALADHASSHLSLSSDGEEESTAVAPPQRLRTEEQLPVVGSTKKLRLAATPPAASVSGAAKPGGQVRAMPAETALSGAIAEVCSKAFREYVLEFGPFPCLPIVPTAGGPTKPASLATAGAAPSTPGAPTLPGVKATHAQTPATAATVSAVPRASGSGASGAQTVFLAGTLAGNLAAPKPALSRTVDVSAAAAVVHSEHSSAPSPVASTAALALIPSASSVLTVRALEPPSAAIAGIQEHAAAGRSSATSGAAEPSSLPPPSVTSGAGTQSVVALGNMAAGSEGQASVSTQDQEAQVRVLMQAIKNEVTADRRGAAGAAAIRGVLVEVATLMRVAAAAEKLAIATEAHKIVFFNNDFYFDSSWQSRLSDAVTASSNLQ
jgi:hypothetical protein